MGLYTIGLKLAAINADTPYKKQEKISGRAYHEITGFGEYNRFGPALNDAMHERYPDTDLAILNARFDTVVTPFSLDPNADLNSPIGAQFTIETDRDLSDDEKAIPASAVSDFCGRNFPGVFSTSDDVVETTAPERCDFGPRPFKKDNETRQLWDPDKVGRFVELVDGGLKYDEREDAIKKISEEESDFADAVASIPCDGPSMEI